MINQYILNAIFLIVEIENRKGIRKISKKVNWFNILLVKQYLESQLFSLEWYNETVIQQMILMLYLL